VKSRAAFVLGSLGELMRTIGDYDRAAAYWQQNLEIFKELRSRSALAFPLLNLGWVYLRKNDYDKAGELFKESLDLFNEFSDKSGALLAIAGLASVLGMTGKPDQGTVVFGATKRAIEKDGFYLEPADQKDLDHYLNVTREQLDKPAFEKAWKLGQTLTIEQVMDYLTEDMDE
jgi:tetratricopeptide (TPR) repeat protein